VFREQKHLVLKYEYFDKFWDDYYILHLQKYQKHFWKMIVLGKKYLNDPREAAIKGCTLCCCLAHDFTEDCAVTHNKETQSNAFGGAGAAKVGIEGYTVVHHTDEQYDELQLDFHSFLSDSNIQEARAVFFHLKQLIIDLRRKNKLKPGSRVLCITDGCAKQYRSATAIYFMSCLASTFNLVVDRGVCCVGHGKSIVDAINGTDKNVIFLGYTQTGEARR